MLKMDMTTNAMFMPRSCWSSAGSVASLAVSVPTEFSSASKNAMDLDWMLWKYSRRYSRVRF